MKRPVVSVITVVRNDAAHIEATLLSVLNQTYQHTEYIVIDGGSTDGTAEIIRKYADRLAYWVSESDKGIYDAMNKGVRHATGSWVNFMNSGDKFANEQVLERVFGGEETWEGKKIIGGNTINVFGDGHEETHHGEPSTVIPKRLPFSHQATFVKTELCRFETTYRYAADYALFYDIYYRYGAESIVTVDEAIARYKQEESLTMNPQNQKKIKEEYLRIQSAHRDLNWWKEYLRWRLKP